MRQFLIAVLLVWTAACVAAALWSRQLHLPSALVSALLPAALLELALYLVPGFPEARSRFDRLGPRRLRALVLLLSALVPWLLMAFVTGFSPLRALVLIALVSVTAFWYAVLRPGPAADLGFLLFMSVVFVSGVFAWIYPRPTPRVALEVLGRLMWIRVGLLSVLSLRRFENVRFGFLPTRADWQIGVEHYLLFLPVGAIFAFWLRFVRFHPIPVVWWKYPLVAIGTFLGMLWVVALAEEFFFRGFLQQLLSRGLGSEIAGLVLASALFGAAHLSFRYFPNWRFAVVAGVAGLFYGMAFLRGRSVRSSMVTHALVVTTWRLFFVAV